MTCTGGGEAVLTVVFDPGSLSEDDACERMENAVREFADVCRVLQLHLPPACTDATFMPRSKER